MVSLYALVQLAVIDAEIANDIVDAFCPGREYFGVLSGGHLVYRSALCECYERYIRDCAGANGIGEDVLDTMPFADGLVLM